MLGRYFVSQLKLFETHLILWRVVQSFFSVICRLHRSRRSTRYLCSLLGDFVSQKR
jgi:hypothetical protein